MYEQLYNAAMHALAVSLRLAATFNDKIKAGVIGRRTSFATLRQALARHKVAPNTAIWLHVSSLGEFEQGRPLIERIKAQNPQQFIVLTFFSPSGYAVRKDYPLADCVLYLPLDTRRNAQRFVEMLQPKTVFWIKYDFWWNYLSALQQRGVPTFLVSGIFAKNHFFFSPFGKKHRQCLFFFKHLFLQNAASAEYLKAVGVTHCSVVGDTRIDRVRAIAQEAKRFELVEAFVNAQNKPIILCGSTWQPDEAILAQYINDNKNALPYRFIIAPHEIKTAKVEDLQRSLAVETVRYSQANAATIGSAAVLLIDNIGLLSALYRYGKIAYIGGAFGAGLHNILEPIAFGLPVIFGTKYQKFEEAVTLTQQGGAFSILDYAGFCSVLSQLSADEPYQTAAAIAQNYLTQHSGATAKILEKVEAT